MFRGIIVLSISLVDRQVSALLESTAECVEEVPSMSLYSTIDVPSDRQRSTAKVDGFLGLYGDSDNMRDAVTVTKGAEPTKAESSTSEFEYHNNAGTIHPTTCQG